MGGWGLVTCSRHTNTNVCTQCEPTVVVCWLPLEPIPETERVALAPYCEVLN